MAASSGRLIGSLHGLVGVFSKGARAFIHGSCIPHQLHQVHGTLHVISTRIYELLVIRCVWELMHLFQDALIMALGVTRHVHIGGQ